MDRSFEALNAAVLEGDFTKVTTVLKDNDIRVSTSLGDDAEVYGAFDEPTALTLAVDCGHIELVRNMLEYGGECYAVGFTYMAHNGIPDSFIPLDYFGAMVHASMTDRFDITQLLAEFRIFKDSRTNLSFRDIVSAAKDGNFDVLATFLDKIDDKADCLRGWKGLNLMDLLLLSQCPTSCIQLMMDHGIDINGWDLNGLTPLRCAVLSKKLENVQFLIEKGADVYAPMLQGDTHFKDSGSFVDDHGSFINVFDSLEMTKSGRSPWRRRLRDCGVSTVMFAASVRNIPILELLLDSSPRHLGFHGTTDIFGDAPLNYAVHYGSLDSINLMLKYKAVRESIGHARSISLAVSYDNMELFELFLKNVTKSWEPFFVYLCACRCARNKPQYLTRLLKSFYKKFRKGDKGGCLFSAIEAGSSECAEILLKLPGFDVNKRYKHFVIAMHSGLTSLMYSCLKGQDDFVRLFLKMGAKVNIKDQVGMTAVMHAASGDHVKCLMLLLEAKADLDKTADGGLTIFFEAMCGNGCCLEVLLKSGKLLDQKTLKLKAVHKKSLENLERHEKSSFIRNMMLLMQYNVFEWEWCSVLPTLLQDIAFAAVALGISPWKFRLGSGSSQTSLLLFACSQKDEATTRYLLANLYFLPEDYRLLCRLTSGTRMISKLPMDMTNSGSSEQETVCMEPLLSQPLSLYQWSFLTISKAVTSSDSSSNERSLMVDSLPLPSKLRDELKFKRKYSQLCYKHWQNLGSHSLEDRAQIDQLVENGGVFRHEVLKHCTRKKCQCGNLGLTFEAGM